MNKIFYVLSSVALSALAVSCQKETEFKIEGTPNFTISVGSDVIVDTDSENFNYTLNLAHQEYSAKKSVKTGNDDVLASSVFEVRSNLRWKIAPAGENEVYDWVSPFPAVGEKDGKFIFKASRKNRDFSFQILCAIISEQKKSSSCFSQEEKIGLWQILLYIETMNFREPWCPIISLTRTWFTQTEST